MLFNVVVIVGLLVTFVSAIPVLRQFRSHPRGLKILFFAEMWERFSYYGMRGLLIFYLTQYFLLEDRLANAQYGAYTSLVYLLPLIGGFVADRYLGTRKAVAFGALLLVAGHFTMAVEGPEARQFLVHGGQRYEVVAVGRASERRSFLEVGGRRLDYTPSRDGGLDIAIDPGGVASPLPRHLAPGSYRTVAERSPFFVGILYLALSLIIVGVGFLKPNISTLVGQLYGRDDPRRDSGFTLYYYGINLGSFWAAILCGLLGQTVGWWAGFGAAGVGMLAGYVAFMRFRGLLGGKGEPPDPQMLRRTVVGPLRFEGLLYLLAIAGVGLVWFLVQSYEVVGSILAIGSAAVLSYFAWFATRCDAAERRAMGLAMTLILGGGIFFTMFDQAGTSLNLFAQRNVALPSSGFFTVTAAQVQSINAGFILLLTPFFSLLWAYLSARKRDPDPLLKFGLGLVQVGLGFFVLVWSAGFADAGFRVPLLVLALTYFLHTTGELCLSPVGLSQVTKLSPPLVVATLMATWFLASAWGQWVGAFFARLAGTETIGGVVLDQQHALEASISVFRMLAWLGVCSGALYLLASLILRWRRTGRALPVVREDAAPQPAAE